MNRRAWKARGAAEKEKYVGGMSSLTLKISGEGVGGAIAGAIGTSEGGSFRVYIDHKTAYLQIEQLMKSFYPEALHIE